MDGISPSPVKILLFHLSSLLDDENWTSPAGKEDPGKEDTEEGRDVYWLFKSGLLEVLLKILLCSWRLLSLMRGVPFSGLHNVFLAYCRTPPVRFWLAVTLHNQQSALYWWPHFSCAVTCCYDRGTPQLETNSDPHPCALHNQNLKLFSAPQTFLGSSTYLHMVWDNSQH